ncbi:hypothetical protein VTK26DRAFT_7013 [Humicola hyalothermophila]
MAYNYGPPPPPPAPAPAQAGTAPASYPAYGAPRGGYSGRGRGNADRGGYHTQPHSNYGYSTQPTYGPQAPTPYPGPPGPQPGYPQAPATQHWQADHGQQLAQQAGPNAAVPAQNYHQAYAPQTYPQQPAYGAQPPYQPATHQPYGQGYPAPPQPANPPPAQHWGGHAQPAAHAVGAYGGATRGGRGGHNDRGGIKGPVMGPPIRWSFDGNHSQSTPAPASTQYPYAGPPAPPAPYTAPYQSYAAPAPYTPAPVTFDGRSGHGPRTYGRGGFHNNNGRSRNFYGGDRNRNRSQIKGPAAHTLPAHPAQYQTDGAASAGRKRRRTNTLGLTPGDDGSDSDGENEEKRLNEMYGADAPNPTTSSEIAAWIAERRAKYPTKARIEAKKAEAKAQNGDTKDSKSSTLEQKAEKLRKQLEKVESSIKRKREQQDEGDDMRDLDLSSSPSSPSFKSEDEKPEAMSSHQDATNPVPPPPRKADPTKHCKYYSTGGMCGKRGKCRFVHDPAVRAAALKEREMNNGRMTLQQRLILNDKQQEDLTIVETLKYLQDKGILDKKPSSSSTSNTKVEATPAPQGQASAAPANETSAHEAPAAKTPATETPAPATPTTEATVTEAPATEAKAAETSVKEEPNHGLPAIPPPPITSDHDTSTTTKYSGWNLSGFGNTGVRPGE